MTDNGYQQAIANFVFEIDKMATEIVSINAPESHTITSFMTKQDVFHQFKDRLEKLDEIVPIIAATYHCSPEQVEEDITAYMQEHITKLEEN